MRKILTGFIFSISLFFAVLSYANSNDIVYIEAFTREECAHCKDEKAFFAELSKTRTDFEVSYLDLAVPENKTLFDKLTKLDDLSKVTPITIVGNQIILGFSTAETTGQQIISLIGQSKGQETLTFQQYIEKGGSDNVPIIGETCSADGSTDCIVDNTYLVNVPFVGVVDISKYSLGLMSVILGFIDGFNPCAMWVLVMFLTFLVEVGSRKKMFQIAGVFILAETMMYYAIMNVWLTTWDFVKLDNIVTPIVGAIAIAAGIYFIYDFLENQGVCKLIPFDQKAKIQKRLKFITTADLTIMSFFAILGIAFSVNIIEFACSIGIPQTFTKILDLNNVSGFMKQVFVLIYILFYMIDDFIVFGIALYSFDKIGVTTKYAKYAHLIGGILMLSLGLILILKPELLVF